MLVDFVAVVFLTVGEEVFFIKKNWKMYQSLCRFFGAWNKKSGLGQGVKHWEYEWMSKKIERSATLVYEWLLHACTSFR